MPYVGSLWPAEGRSAPYAYGRAALSAAHRWANLSRRLSVTKARQIGVGLDSQERMPIGARETELDYTVSLTIVTLLPRQSVARIRDMVSLLASDFGGCGHWIRAETSAIISL